MPRKPQENNNHCNCWNESNVDFIDDAIDLKLQLLQQKVDKKLENKQDKLEAGENITIEGNVISAHIDQPTPPVPPTEEVDVFFFQDNYIPEEIDD